MARLQGVLVGVVGLFSSAVACRQIAGIGGETLIECVTTQDCTEKAPVCEVATACEQGVCVFDDVAEGTPTAEQAPGDCLQAVCDGAGKVKMVVLEADPPDDGNICTLDTCLGATPQHAPQAEVTCRTGLLGICAEGMQKCEAGQPVGSCVGPEPKAERCDEQELDEDCDGLVNEEGANCVCGDGYISKGEECDDGGIVGGDKCSATCREEKVLQVAVGANHTCTLLNGGSVKCWGTNGYGKLGLGDKAERGDEPGEMGDSLPSVNLGTGKTATAITAGADHTCALLNDSSVKCWGNNSGGQLGLGDRTHRGGGPGQMGDSLLSVDLGTGKTATAIAAGDGHTCALLNDSSVKCWGGSSDGELGLGDRLPHGNGPGQMGDSLPSVNLGTGKTATAIAVGYSHTCALLNDSSVKCWGSNDYGKLGLGDKPSHGSEPGDMGDGLPAVNLGTSKAVTAIAAGTNHTCALLTDSSVKCWGSNEFGQLGLGDKTSRGDEPGDMGDNLPAVNLGMGKTATAIAAGLAHTCARLNDSSVKCWGSNEFGELGLGDKAYRGGEPGEIGDSLPSINLGTGKIATAIAAGAVYTCARLNDSSVKCWGRNDFGQLGLGDTDNRGDNPNEMGDNLSAVKLYSNTW